MVRVISGYACTSFSLSLYSSAQREGLLCEADDDSNTSKVWQHTLNTSSSLTPLQQEVIADPYFAYCKAHCDKMDAKKKVWATISLAAVTSPCTSIQRNYFLKFTNIQRHYQPSLTNERVIIKEHSICCPLTHPLFPSAHDALKAIQCRVL